MAHIEIRPARAEDREPVLAFCAHTWEWGDYVERVWDEWFNDPNGQLLAATADGQPVGIVHLSMITETDAWIEGLRVDPNYRRQGIATALDTAAMAEAMNRGATYVRLVTESINTASTRLCEQLHMRQVGGFAPFTAEPLPRVSSRNTMSEPTQLATREDLDEIIDYLNASNVFPVVGGLYYTRFTGYVFTDTMLEEHIDQQHVYLLRRWDRLDGLAIAEVRSRALSKKELSIGYIDGTTIESISLIAYDLRSRLLDMGLERAFVYAPDLMLVRDGLSGIEYEWNGSLFVTYERGLV